MYSDVCIEMKILILYSAIGSMATVDSALFSSSAIRVIKMIVLSLLRISLNLPLAKLVMEHISNLSILQLRQYRIILSADTASEVRQMPSQKRR